MSCPFIFYVSSQHKNVPFPSVTQPLALVLYEKLLPGSRLKTRLSELGWRVEEIKSPEALIPSVKQHKPLVVITDLEFRSHGILPALNQVGTAQETSHVPILAYCNPSQTTLAQDALDARVKLVAAESGILEQLPQLLDHVLAID
jgi:DNA-binding NarL/FixJ family response regulator